MTITRNDIKTALKDILEFSLDGTDLLLYERLKEEHWERITDKIEGELRQVGIKVN